LILNQRTHIVPRQLLTPGKEFEFDDKYKANNDTTELLDEIDNCAGGAAGGEEVVGDNDAMAVADSVAMDLKGVLTIFQIVRNRRALSRQLAWFAYRHEPCSKVIRQRGRKDKTTRFDSDY
jgi:hypothetical protein